MFNEVTKWFEIHQRDLPWRKSTPWGVMISEFMLQQTPVIRVLPKWSEWITRWPTPRNLAESEKSEAINAWGGLGYPRRAIRLWESSRIISSDYANQVPSTVEELMKLPGVGSYTARAIASFAFSQSHCVLDINIRRVFSRVIDGQESPTLTPSKQEESQRPVFGPTWSAALMELGALVCTARNPRCEECPIASYCSWRAQGYPKSVERKKSQSWHGTNRQCRGLILKTFREGANLITEDEIDWNEREQLQLCLRQLVQEGFLQERRGKYSLG
jgi:A/G-specific adenine glycosylase